jgi:hypothetical protein
VVSAEHPVVARPAVVCVGEVENGCYQ